MSKKKLTYKDFLNYFRNNLQSKDKHVFEKQMMQDAFEEEAFDGLSSLDDTILEKDIEELKAGIANRSQKTRSLVPVWLRYAASVAILASIGISALIFNNKVLKDSSLEKLSEEFEIMDSVVLREEVMAEKTKQDSGEDRSTEEKMAVVEKPPVPEAEYIIVADDVEIEDELILDETDLDEDIEIEIVEFDYEEEEAAEEELFIAFAKEERQIEEAKAAGNQGRGEEPRAKKSRKVMESQPAVIPQNTITISGKVLSAEDGLAVPGVSIVVEGKERIGTSTDVDGEFSLTLPNEEDIQNIVAMSVGMMEQVIPIGADTNLLVMLEPDVLEMDEVVVVGYGVSEKDSSDEDPLKINAKPPGGISKRKYKEKIVDNLDYKILSKYPGKHKIKLTFNVFDNGYVRNINFQESPNQDFETQIRRVIEDLGDWIPASTDGVNQSSQVKLTLKIEIK